MCYAVRRMSRGLVDGQESMIPRIADLYGEAYEFFSCRIASYNNKATHMPMQEQTMTRAETKRY